MLPLALRVATFVFGDKIVQYTLYALAGVLVFSVLEGGAAFHAVEANPWGQWWLAGQYGARGTSVSSLGSFIGLDVPLVDGSHAVTDVERYQLAVAAGFSGDDATTAVAISIAEDGNGDPAREHVNSDKEHTIDLGLWQINSRHWERFGGKAALIVPMNNARAAYALYHERHDTFGAWTTYTLGTYLSYMQRAQLAALQSLTRSSDEDIANGVVAAALAYVGTPYRWMACTRNGIDCSCLVQNAEKAMHIVVPRTTVAQIAVTKYVPWGQERTGDVIFFDNTCQDCGANPTHVGLIVSRGVMVDAREPSVTVESYDTPYWRSKFRAIGRF